MKHLHGYVNIVPVIAKADTLTIEERDSFKQRIREDLNFHGISIYPSAYGAEDEEDASANAKIEVREWVHWRLGDSWSLLLSLLPPSLPSSLPSLLPPSPLTPSLPPSLQQYIPFAVIGSDREVVVSGKKLLGRQTKWGFIEVENRKHCEFSQLRDMLIK